MSKKAKKQIILDPAKLLGFDQVAAVNRGSFCHPKIGCKPSMAIPKTEK